MTEYPKRERHEPAPGPAPEPPRRQTLLEWVTDICRVKQTTKPYPAGKEAMTGCVDGLVHPEVRGYTVAYKCPLCNRADDKITPRIKTWPGEYTLYTDEELKKIQDERMEVRKRILGGRNEQVNVMLEEQEMDRKAAGE